MRVISGSAKGRALRVPSGLGIRPTPSKVREAIFSIISVSVHRAQVLDLYCGVGSLAIEALSRGADRAVLVDQSRKALSFVHQNLENTGFSKHAECKLRRLPKGITSSLGGPFDLIFSDPPYQESPLPYLVEKLSRVGLASPGTIWVHELPSKQLADVETDYPGWRASDSRTYGDTGIIILTRSQEIT